MARKSTVVMVLFVILVSCPCFVLASQYFLNGCFWWECVPERSFGVLEWKIPANMVPEGALVSPMMVSSEGAGEIERGSQNIFGDGGNDSVIYNIYRYPSIRKAIVEYASYAKRMVDDETRNVWIQPKELIYSSSTADEMQIACGDWMERRCGMRARYQEYVIFFTASMGKEMTYTEFEKIVIYLDQQISSRLYP
jgi:hypothetical protein